MTNVLMSTWNDERLDELSQRMDAGFARVDREMKEGFAKVDSEMKAGFARVDKEIGDVRVELHRLNDRFDRLLNRLTTMSIGFAGAVIATAIGWIAFGG